MPLSLLELLADGQVEEFNARRGRRAAPDLFAADLSGASLSGADLSGANLEKADLSGADLSNTDLAFANLTEADLSGANLSEANLEGANLTGAHLSKAQLYKTRFSGADLSGANLTDVSIVQRLAQPASPGKLARLEAQERLKRLPWRRTLTIDDGPDFGGAILKKAILRNTHLSYLNFGEAHLEDADLHKANLTGCNFTCARLDRANLSEANLSEANLAMANLTGANLNKANLFKTDLNRADLTGANLSGALLMGTNLASATLNDCLVYGTAVWDAQLVYASQLNLRITPRHELSITVDNLNIAQFIYLLLNNREIRQIIDTLTSKVVLLLGRFTPERKAVLDALKNELRNQNYTPVVFDFDIPESRDITETVSLLARMARFIIADITDARSIPQELSTIIPDLPSVPVQPLLSASASEYSMFEHFKKYPWVLKEYLYTSTEDLLSALKEQIIQPAEQKVQELRNLT